MNKVQIVQRLLFVVVAALVVVQLVVANTRQQADASPRPISSGFTQVNAGSRHVCGVRSGVAYCWGVDENGSLGNGLLTADSTYVYPEPVSTSGVLAGKTVSSVHSGYDFSCALTIDNKLYCWGLNNHGQLGNNSTTTSAVPVAVDMSGDLQGVTIASLSVGYQNACALDTNGVAYCWGSNVAGEMGSGAQGSDILTPHAVDTNGVLNGVTLRSISTSSLSTCAVGVNGQVYCWGRIMNDSPIPAQIDNSSINVSMRDVSVSVSNMCEVGVNGQAYCMGKNQYGQLGDGTTNDASLPVAVDVTGALGGQAVEHISVGYDDTVCAQSYAGRVYCWGYNDVHDGQEGKGVLGVYGLTTVYSAVPVQTDAFGANVATSITNGTTKCSLTNNGAVLCWAGTQGRANGLTDGDNQPGVATYVSEPGPNIRYLSKSYVYADDTDAQVIIYGDDFDDTTTVQFGSVSAHVESWTPTQLVVTVPTSGYSQAALVSVTVTNASGYSDTLPSSFTFQVYTPSIDALSQNDVLSDGNDYTLSVFGFNFRPGATVKVDGVAVATTYVDDMTLTVVVRAPKVTQDTVVDVTVTNPNGISVTQTDALTFVVAQISSITGVNFAQSSGRTIMTVTGQHFPDANQAMLTPRYATFNGAQLPFCSDGFGLSAQEIVDSYGLSVQQVSDAAPCFFLIQNNTTVLSDTQMLVWLPRGFNTAAKGVISIGSASFTFNATNSGSEPSTGNGGKGVQQGASGGVSVTSGLSNTSISLDGSENTSSSNEGDGNASQITPTARIDKTILKNEAVISAQPTFSGIAVPGSRIEVLVHSDPVTCEAVADDKGMWTCELPKTLPVGNHTVTVMVTSPTGAKTVLGPYSVMVKSGESAVVTGTTKKDESGSNLFANGIKVLLVLVVIASIIFIVRRIQKRRSV